MRGNDWERKGWERRQTIEEEGDGFSTEIPFLVNKKEKKFTIHIPCSEFQVVMVVLKITPHLTSF